MGFLDRLFGRKDRDALTPLYNAVVTEARRPAWYLEGQVPDTLVVAELDKVGCFQHEALGLGPEGQFPLTAVIPGGGRMAASTADAQTSAIAQGEPGSTDRRSWLKHYVEQRTWLTEFAYSNFGLAGVQAMQRTYLSPEHAAVVDLLREEAGSPDFFDGLDIVQRAKVRSLLRDPARFLPCGAVKYGA